MEREKINQVIDSGFSIGEIAIDELIEKLIQHKKEGATHINFWGDDFGGSYSISYYRDETDEELNKRLNSGWYVKNGYVYYPWYNKSTNNGTDNTN